eukprot:11736857-Alexandrium_andersonii.AAC.1
MAGRRPSPCPSTPRRPRSASQLPGRSRRPSRSPTARLRSWSSRRPPPCSPAPVSYTHLTLPTICSV